MMRTLIISGRDLAGEELRRLSTTQLAEQFLSGECKLTGEPGHHVVVELLKAGHLAVILFDVFQTEFVVLTTDGKGGARIGCRTPSTLLLREVEALGK